MSATALTEPSLVVERLERERELPAGAEERMAGYGVMAAPFRSGDLLAMRRFSASSVGPAYTSVWHRSADGAWTFWSTVDPLQSCPRYFGNAITTVLVSPIEIEWPTPRRMTVRIPDRLEWSLDLESTRATRALNGIARAMPESLWRSPIVLELMGHVAGALLHAGHLGLTGHVPNGQKFAANPRQIWSIASSVATLDGRTLTELAPLPEQARLGDFWLPQRGLFAVGRAFFEP